MTGVEDGSETDTRLKRFDNHGVDVIVDDMTFGGMIDRVDDFIVPVLLIAVEIFSLTTVT